MNTIVVVGTGYVGLVSGACLAHLGHRVICVDIDVARVDTLNQGGCPLYEKGLDSLLETTRAQGRLSFQSQMPDLRDVDAVFLGVGTPQSDSGKADMRHVYAAFDALLPLLGANTVVVTKSTVPVGTHATLIDRMKKARPDLEGHIASNPEFLREGSAVADFLSPDRVVLGVATPHARSVLASVYAPLAEKGVPCLFMAPESAEISKYAANAFLAAKISFINEIAGLCEAVGGNVGDVKDAIGSDTRIGFPFLDAGPGYGGSCFPKDTSALVHIARDALVSVDITKASIAANTTTKERVIRTIIETIGGIEGKKIAILGLAFKANTDDMRDGSVIDISRALMDAGADVHGTDPVANNNAQHVLDITIHDTVVEAATGADAVVLMTDWAVYREQDLASLRALMAKEAVAIDLRRAWSLDALWAAGFDAVYRIGERPYQKPG